MNQPKRPLIGKKLLVAAIGVGALNLTGCHGFTSGNLVAPPPCDDAGHYECGPDLATPPDAGTSKG